MPADDIVAELDDWLAREATTLKHYPADDVDTELLERARDEIVALREMREAEFRMLSTNRDEVLEVAAHECDEEAKGSSEGFRDGCETCAAAIRALKNKAEPHS